MMQFYRILTGILLSYCLAGSSWAQRAMYWDLSIGYGRGTHENFRLGIDFILPGGLSLGAAEERLERRAPNVPADYQVGLCVWDNCMPKRITNAYGILVGRAIPLSPSFRLNLRGGLALNAVEEPVNFTPLPPDPLNLASNYRYDKKHYFNAGLLIEPRVEFLPAHTWGLAFGGFAHFNKTHAAFGVFLDLLGGWRLRARRT